MTGELRSATLFSDRRQKSSPQSRSQTVEDNMAAGDLKQVSVWLKSEELGNRLCRVGMGRYRENQKDLLDHVKVLFLFFCFFFFER